MGRTERLKLLFEQDETLLRTDTHLNKALRVKKRIPETVQDSVAVESQLGANIGNASEKQVVGTATVSAPSPQLPKTKDKFDKEPDELSLDNASAGGKLVKSSLNGVHDFSKGAGEANTHIPRNKLEVVEDSSSKGAVDTSHGHLHQLFCPLLAVSRFPYRYIQGEFRQKAASRFFDQGKFWDRQWDLYYTHVPPQLGSRSLLLVPAAQVNVLIQEINNIFGCNLTLPTDEHVGFALSFSDERTPSPVFLGQSSSRELKDQLEANIPLRSAKYNDYDSADPVFVEFEKTVEAGIVATKNKKKASSKAKKQLVRVHAQYEWARCLKRVQCYFGRRPRCVRNGACPGISGEAAWEEKGEGLANGTAVQPLSEHECAPCSFWNDPVFVSVDVESNERSHSQVTEIGISTLDTHDLVGIPPGKDGENWISRIKARHLRTREYAYVVNKDFVSGCPEKFEFGESEWVSLEDLVATVDGCFQRPYSSEVTMASNANDIEPEPSNETPRRKLRNRNVVLVGHNPSADIAYLRSLGVTVFDRADCDQEPFFLDAFDTAEAFRILLGESTQRSLSGILEEFGITGWYLHNAGNDARYTMEAMVRIILRSKSSIDKGLGQDAGDASEEFVASQVMAEGGSVDDIDGGEPKGITKA